MASRVGLLGILLLACGIVATSATARQPPVGTAIFVVRQDQRLCPSPLCGGYWVEIANGARTRCADGLRHPRCYVATAVDARGKPLERVADGALVRGAIDAGRDDLGELVATTAYAPAGQAAVGGGYYRITDTGVRCVRAPCFSWRATQANGATRTPVSSVDLDAAKATVNETARARAALGTTNGLLARGRFVSGADGRRVFRALRLYLRAPQPRA